jgi:mono/diheme cytochrome c family protein
MIASVLRATPAVLLVLVSGPALALPWNQDMVDQPAVKAQETRVDEPRGAVPAGHQDAPAKPQSLADLVLARVQAGTLPNPQEAKPESVARGKALYETHCLPCHGASGHGDGPVGLKFVPPPMNLTLDYVQQQPDGQLWYTITYGGVVMPFYHDSIVAADRWHVVNYIKHGLVPR